MKILKILLVLSLILNGYLAYKINNISFDNSILAGELSACGSSQNFSLEIIRATLTGKSKEDVMQILPNVSDKKFYKTQQGIEILRLGGYKFEFMEDKLKFISNNPR